MDLIPDGFVFTARKVSTTVRWSEIVQIDAGVRDLLSLDLMFVVFHSADATVAIDEFDDGFGLLEQRLLDRWPQLRARWVALHCGSSHQPQREVLWQRDL